MSKPKVAIIGASGFSGSSLCERLFFNSEFEPVPILHTPARSARLARFPVQLRVADLLDIEQVRKAINGCDYLVNCSRGDIASMTKGLRNLIQAGTQAGAKGLIHISSTAIYGNFESGVTIDESARPRPEN